MAFTPDQQTVVQTMANEKARPACDRIAGLYGLVGAFLSEYQAKYQALVDGAEAGQVIDPGRRELPHQFTKEDIQLLVSGLSALKSKAEEQIDPLARPGETLVTLATKFFVNARA